MVHTKFQASEPSVSKDEDYLINSYTFLWFKPQTSSILDPGTFVWTDLVKDYQAMLHTKFQAPEPSRSREEDFLVYFIF